MEEYTEGHHLMSGLFGRGVCSAAMCRSRGPPPASSSPLAAYIQQPSRPSHHTTHSNKPRTVAAVYTYSRRSASSAKRAEARWGKRASYAARAACISLTCSAVITGGLTGRSCRPRVFACAAATCISRQTCGGSCSAASPAALCCNTPCSHAPSLLSPLLSSTHSTKPVSRHTHTHAQRVKYE